MKPVYLYCADVVRLSLGQASTPHSTAAMRRFNSYTTMSNDLMWTCPLEIVLRKQTQRTAPSEHRKHRERVRFQKQEKRTGSRSQRRREEERRESGTDNPIHAVMIGHAG